VSLPEIDAARKELHRVYAFLSRNVFHGKLRGTTAFSFLKRRRRRGKPHGWYRRGSRSYELGAVDLTLPALQFLHVLVHEMVHEWADRKGIQEVPPGSNYHSKRFCDLALSYGLVPTYQGVVGGWGNTRPRPRLRLILRRCALRTPLLRKAAAALGPRPRSRWGRWACRCGPVRVPRPTFKAKCLKCGRIFRR
jgi:hypothetical protein